MQSLLTNRYTSNELVAQIVTDRPDATESAVTVPEGAFQIESGISFGDFGGNSKMKEFGIPMGLIRYGLLSNFELRLAYNLVGQSNSDFKDQATFKSYNFGIKYAILKEDGLIPDLVILSNYSLEKEDSGEFTQTDINGTELGTGDGDYLDQSFDIRMAFAYSLPMDFAFGGNLGTVVWIKPDEDRGKFLSDSKYPRENTDARYFDLYEWTANLEYSAMDNLAFYSELFGDFNSDEARTNLNVGVKFLATQNMQLDAFYIKALSLPESEKMNNDYYQVGFGFSYLWN